MSWLEEGEKELWIGAIRDHILVVVDLNTFSRMYGIWMEKWGETGKNDVTGVTEFGMCEVYQRTVRTPAGRNRGVPWTGVEIEAGERNWGQTVELPKHQ